LQGLSTVEAQARLLEFGPNSVPEKKPNRILAYLGKFWGAVPWMLELIIVLELTTHHIAQAAIIALLLIFNTSIAFLQENSAQNALALLREKLIVRARVLRDRVWQLLSAEELVPGDVIHLRMGDFIPADVNLVEGQVTVDQSALTGESLEIDLGQEETAHAGGIVLRGEATAQVLATGTRTLFGRTVELVGTAKTASHLEEMILKLVKYLVVLDTLLVVGVLIYAQVNALPLSESIPFALIVLVASVPVALPATFTLASALGARELAGQGVLVTRLSAIEEAAAMDILCSDKTGTITQNQLTLSTILSFEPCKEVDTLRYAALSSDEASQDPLDLAIIRAARERGLLNGNNQRVQFIPFDPQTKRTEAVVQTGSSLEHVIKGLPQVVLAQVADHADVGQEIEHLAAQGDRVLAVSHGSNGHQDLAGLLGFSDHPRSDSKDLIRSLRDLAVRVVMITGDGLATAQAVAAQVGLGDKACAAEVIRQGSYDSQIHCDVVAGVFPEDKFHLVRCLQKNGHVVGMTGDGVNDAPALKQAEVGIAVANATDVAKAAASIVLTNPGLSDVLSAVKIGRQIYQRMLTYTLNKIIKTFQIALFLSLGLLLTGKFLITPLLVILLLFANDFVTMSLASDRVRFSRKPERWRLRPLIISALVIAVAWLLFSFGILFMGASIYHLELPELQTLVFVMLVFTGQANVYLVRERGHFWDSMPGRALSLSTLGDIFIVIFLATQGFWMAAITISLVGSVIGMVAIYMLGLDWLKLFVFKKLGVAN